MRLESQKRARFAKFKRKLATQKEHMRHASLQQSSSKRLPGVGARPNEDLGQSKDSLHQPVLTAGRQVLKTYLRGAKPNQSLTAQRSPNQFRATAKQPLQPLSNQLQVHADPLTKVLPAKKFCKVRTTRNSPTGLRGEEELKLPNLNKDSAAGDNFPALESQQDEDELEKAHEKSFHLADV